MSTLLRRLRTAYHNCVLHPIAGVLWFVGLQAAGDRVHGEPKPRWWVVVFHDGDVWADPDPAADAAAAAGSAVAARLHVAGGEVIGAYVHAADEAGAYRGVLRLIADREGRRAAAPAADDTGYW